MMIHLLLALLAYSVVPNVDFDRYSGTWYEIARYPNRFQEKCVGDVTAHYGQREDGKIDVLNRCRAEDGSYISARGLARSVGKGQPNSVLKVRFAPAFLSFIPQVWGDYQIIVLAPDYSYAAVGSPDLKYLWILARKPDLPQSAWEQIVAELQVMGFDVNQLQRTGHSGNGNEAASEAGDARRSPELP
jgi:apolipoprotein D and lipocalin family protein